MGLRDLMIEESIKGMPKKENPAIQHGSTTGATEMAKLFIDSSIDKLMFSIKCNRFYNGCALCYYSTNSIIHFGFYDPDEKRIPGLVEVSCCNQSVANFENRFGDVKLYKCRDCKIVKFPCYDSLFLFIDTISNYMMKEKIACLWYNSGETCDTPGSAFFDKKSIIPPENIIMKKTNLFKNKLLYNCKNKKPGCYHSYICYELRVACDRNGIVN